VVLDISIYNIDGKNRLRSVFASNAFFTHIQRYSDINARGIYPVMYTYVLRTHTVLHTTYPLGHKR